MTGTKRSHNRWEGPQSGSSNRRCQERYSRRPFGNVSGKSPDAKDATKLLGHVVQLFFWEIRGQSVDVDIGRDGRI